MSVNPPDPDATWEAPGKRLRGSTPHYREADHLSERVLARAPRSDYAKEFVEHRFRFPLVNYRKRSTQAAGLHIGINLATAAGGLATAAIVSAGGDSSAWKAAIIGIGIVVGILSGMNQILRPGQRNVAYARTWLDLRTEGWHYVCGLGEYAFPVLTDAETASKAAWARFTTQVIGAQQDAEKLAEPGGTTVEQVGSQQAIAAARAGERPAAATRRGRVSPEEAYRRLCQIDHIVVLMMENRSFDHMLGYLSLSESEGGRGRADIDGLTGPDHNFNMYDGQRHWIEPMGAAGLTKIQDPGHSGADVGQQMAHGMSGFVTNYMTTRAYQSPQDVMRYQRAPNVPVYDFFAEHFAVCDRWFCSVPGSTWPNRLAALTGEAGSTDNRFPPLYSHRSFVRSLPADVSWRWYSSDPGSLRLVDSDYRIGHETHFAFVDKPSVAQSRTFHTDAMKEELPNVAWIDPNFVDLGGLHGANDDHPPTDVMAGQSLVLKIYQSLKQSAQWEKSMLVIVYDEHGGFYDHVDPTVGLPVEFSQRSEFRHFGPRVPALVVSPFIEAGAAFGSKQANDASLLFDHTALIRTILLRFAGDNCTDLPERVQSSSHLGYVLSDGPARDAPDIPNAQLDDVTSWWAMNIRSRLLHPSATVPALQELGVADGTPGLQSIVQGIAAVLGRAWDWMKARVKPEPESPDEGLAPAAAVLADASELQVGMAAAARHIRSEGLPPGQP